MVENAELGLENIDILDLQATYCIFISISNAQGYQVFKNEASSSHSILFFKNR
jgi:hypothetical protein